MNKLMYRFVDTTKKKKKRNRPVFRHCMPLRASRVKKKEIDPFLDTVCPLRAFCVINSATHSETNYAVAVKTRFLAILISIK